LAGQAIDLADGLRHRLSSQFRSSSGLILPDEMNWQGYCGGQNSLARVVVGRLVESWLMLLKKADSAPPTP